MKPLRFLGAIAVLALLVHKSAFAQTFVSTSANILNTGFEDGNLIVRWTESGLQPGTPVSYTVTVGSEITSYACVQNKRGGTFLDSIPLTDADYGFTLPVSRHGTISQTVGIDESDPDRTCLAGKIVLWKVDYSDVEIYDDTNGVHDLVGGGNFSLTFCNLTKNAQNCPPPS